METDGRRMRQLLAGLGEMDMAGTKELHSGQLEKTIRSPSSGRHASTVGGKCDRRGHLTQLISTEYLS